jgi:polyhydroxybutyrate depolymerase
MRLLVQPVFALALVHLLGCGAAADDDDGSGDDAGADDDDGGGDERDFVLSLESGGLGRRARVHLPPALATPAAVVLDFHGYSNSPTLERGFSRLDAVADLEGFAVVYPEGTGAPAGWDAGSCCVTGVDDVGFTAALIDALAERIELDPARVYATGLSNGGFLSHRLGCELADRIAAIAPVAGVNLLAACAPSRPIAVLMIHGTGDAYVPYDGGGPFDWPSVADSEAGWAERDDCGAPSTSYQQGDASCARRACAAGTEVELCTIDGGGHVWPGGTAPAEYGHVTDDLDGAQYVWDFFARHPMPE